VRKKERGRAGESVSLALILQFDHCLTDFCIIQYSLKLVSVTARMALQ